MERRVPMLTYASADPNADRLSRLVHPPSPSRSSRNRALSPPPQRSRRKKRMPRPPPRQAFGNAPAVYVNSKGSARDTLGLQSIVEKTRIMQGNNQFIRENYFCKDSIYRDAEFWEKEWCKGGEIMLRIVHDHMEQFPYFMISFLQEEKDNIQKALNKIPSLLLNFISQELKEMLLAKFMTPSLVIELAMKQNPKDIAKALKGRPDLLCRLLKTDYRVLAASNTPPRTLAAALVNDIQILADAMSVNKNLVRQLSQESSFVGSVLHEAPAAVLSSAFHGRISELVAAFQHDPSDLVSVCEAEPSLLAEVLQHAPNTLATLFLEHPELLKALLKNSTLSVAQILDDTDDLGHKILMQMPNVVEFLWLLVKPGKEEWVLQELMLKLPKAVHQLFTDHQHLLWEMLKAHRNWLAEFFKKNPSILADLFTSCPELIDILLAACPGLMSQIAAMLDKGGESGAAPSLDSLNTLQLVAVLKGLSEEQFVWLIAKVIKSEHFEQGLQKVLAKEPALLETLAHALVMALPAGGDYNALAVRLALKQPIDDVETDSTAMVYLREEMKGWWTGLGGKFVSNQFLLVDEYPTRVADNEEGSPASHGVEEIARRNSFVPQPKKEEGPVLVPRAWHKYLKGKVKTKEPAQQAIRIRQLIYKIYTEKVEADEIDRREGNDVAPLDHFVINYMLTNFGHKNIVKKKLQQLIKGLNVYMKQDAWILAFARFLGINIQNPDGAKWPSQIVLHDDNTPYDLSFLNTYLWGLEMLMKADDEDEELLNVLDDQERKKMAKELKKTETFDPHNVMVTIKLRSAMALLTKICRCLDAIPDDAAEKAVNSHAIDVFRFDHMDLVDLCDLFCVYVGLIKTQQHIDRDRYAALFRKQDTDSSGKMSYGEFKAMCTSLPGLAHLTEGEVADIFNKATEDAGEDEMSEEVFSTQIASELMKRSSKPGNTFLPPPVGSEKSEGMKVQALLSRNLRALFDKYDESNGQHDRLGYPEMRLLFKEIGLELHDDEFLRVCDLIDPNGDAFVSFSELLLWWRDYGLTALFKHFDEDGSGYLSIEQFITLLKNVLGANATEENIQAAIQSLHLHRPNHVYYAEFVSWWSFFDAQQAFSDIDGKCSGHPDGQIDVAELSALLRDLGIFLHPEELARYLEQLDTDHSDSLSFEEFMPWFLHVKKGLDNRKRRASVHPSGAVCTAALTFNQFRSQNLSYKKVHTMQSKQTQDFKDFLEKMALEMGIDAKDLQDKYKEHAAKANAARSFF